MVLWLDDMEDYLESGDCTIAVLQQLMSNYPGLVVVATAHDSALATLQTQFDLAALVAIVLSLIDVEARTKKRPTPSAWHWWTLRLSLEGLAGVVAVPLLAAVVGAPWPEEVWAGLIAGAAGAAIMRSTIVTIDVGGNRIPVGGSSIYDPIRKYLERQIDDKTARYETEWVLNKVIPSLQASSPKEVGDRVKYYISILDRIPAKRKEEETKWIEERVYKAKSTDNEKIELLVYKALELGAHGLIKDLVAHPLPSSVPSGQIARAEP